MGLIGNRPDARFQIVGNREPEPMAVFKVEFPHSHVLLFTQANPALVKAAVEKMGVRGWKNAYPKGEPQFHLGLEELLGSTDGVAFVRRWWRKLAGQNSPIKESNTPCVEFLKHTCGVVHDVAVALGMDPGTPVTLTTPLPKGGYIYYMGQVGMDRSKGGHVEILKDGGTIMECRWANRKDDGCAIPAGYEGVFDIAKCTLLHLVPGTF